MYAEKIFRLTKRFHILRVPGIYAQNRLPLERLKSRKPALVSSDDVYSNHIHADDLARVSYMSLFKGRKKRVTNVVDDSKLKMADYFDLIADFYNLPKPPRVDKNELKKLVEQEVLSTMMASFFQESRRLKNIRLKKELRVSLRFPDVEYFLKKNFNKN